MTSTGQTPGAARLLGVVVPAEHGGWSLTLEPVLLGLLVAPSWAGSALGGVALSAFLLRTPVKVAVGDRLRQRRLPRTRLAERAMGAYGSLFAVLLVVASILSEPGWWDPLAVALPMFATEIVYDVRARSRRFVPEMLGTVGIGSVAAAIVLADGGPSSIAWGLWIVTAARAIAAIPFVRVQLRRGKQQPFHPLTSDGSQALACVVAATGAVITDIRWPTVGAVAGLAAFHIAALRRPVPRVAIIGSQQIVVGLTVVLVTALSVLAP